MDAIPLTGFFEGDAVLLKKRKDKLWTVYDRVILDQLQTWCQNHRLIIHEGKCDAVLLDTKPFIAPLKPLVWGDKTIEYRSFSVCLGIAIDERLSWANHVKSASTSHSSKVNMLRRISFFKSHTRNNL